MNFKEFPRGILDQVISLRAHDGECERAPGPGLMLPDSKMVKQRATSSTSRDQERQASSGKPQASSFKPQASSGKQQASSIGYSCKQQALDVVPIVKRQAWRFAMIGQETVDRG